MVAKKLYIVRVALWQQQFCIITVFTACNVGVLSAGKLLEVILSAVKILLDIYRFSNSFREKSVNVNYLFAQFKTKVVLKIYQLLNNQSRLMVGLVTYCVIYNTILGLSGLPLAMLTYVIEGGARHNCPEPCSVGIPHYQTRKSVFLHLKVPNMDSCVKTQYVS